MKKIIVLLLIGTLMIGLSSCGHEHVVEKIEKINATCTETGLTEGKICSTCGEILVAQKEISAKGHNYVKGVCTSCKKEDPNMKAYDKLNQNEKDFYNTIINNIYDFKDPSSVKVVSVNFDYWNAALEVYIQAKNGYGGEVKSKYLYFYKNITITDELISIYSSAAMVNGQVLTPKDVVGTAKKGDLISYSYCEELWKDGNILVYPGGKSAYTITHQLFTYQFKKGEMASIEINVGKINAALEEFKTSKGW